MKEYFDEVFKKLDDMSDEEFDKLLLDSGLIPNGEYIHKFINNFKKEYPNILIDYTYDDEDDYYIIYHNAKDLLFNQDFLNKVGKLIKEILYENDVFNVSFGYDFEEILER